MKVFISWSGERSKALAEALRYWLPKVIQALEPWMSADDIEKGSRWRTGISRELEESKVGIICLTRENLESTWIHFEAGALSKQQQNTYVLTLLFDLEATDVREPLAQFQATKAQKQDLRKLISTINNTLGDQKLSEAELAESFDVWWSKLEDKLTAIPRTTSQNEAAIRKDRDILEEILSLTRAQSRNSYETHFPTNVETPTKMIFGGNLTARGKRIVAEATGLAPIVIQSSLFEREAVRDMFIEATGDDALARDMLARASRMDVGTRPSRLNLPSTVTWEIPEANALYSIWRIAQVQLADLKSGDSISERRVQELEEFANNLASDESFARAAFENVKADSTYYDYLLKSPRPNQQS